jgi:hypothetical protein
LPHPGNLAASMSSAAKRTRLQFESWMGRLKVLLTPTH